MDKEGKFWFSIFGATFVAIVLITGIISLYNYQDDKLFTSNGYTQVILPGSCQYNWQKIKK